MPYFVTEHGVLFKLDEETNPPRLWIMQSKSTVTDSPKLPAGIFRWGYCELRETSAFETPHTEYSVRLPDSPQIGHLRLTPHENTAGYFETKGDPKKQVHFTEVSYHKNKSKLIDQGYLESCKLSGEAYWNGYGSLELVTPPADLGPIDPKVEVHRFLSVAGKTTRYLAYGQSKESDSTVDDFIMVGYKQIDRLNHWWVWNGRKKAKHIQDAINTVEAEVVKDPELKTSESSMQLLKDSGFFDAMSEHRFGFTSGKTRSDRALEKLDKVLPDTQATGIKFKL